MDEVKIINKIKEIVNNDFIGDDCAYLKDIGIVVSQDSLVEGVHFKREFCTPYQLGLKSAAVNISDILASGAEPKYLTVALSLPRETQESFISDFYKGFNKATYGAKIVGGDITASKDVIYISVTAIGTASGRNISSRKFAKEGYIVLVKGNHGTSACGLRELQTGGENNILIKAHLEPVPEYEFSKKISTTVSEEYAMMDTSDGLADALFKIAHKSNVRINVDYDKIPHMKGISKDYVLFGGEDYKLVAVIPEKYASNFNEAAIIGSVVKYDGVYLDISGERYNNYNQLSVYNHFGENNG